MCFAMGVGFGIDATNGLLAVLPQGEVIEKILRHCGLLRPSAPRAPPESQDLILELDDTYTDSSIGSQDKANQAEELTYVDIDTFLATF